MKQKILAAVCALALCAALVPAGFAEQDTAATAPVAENLELTTFRSTSIGGTLSATAPDGSPLTFRITTEPIKGTVTLTDSGTFVYTPADGKRGRDYFGFRAADSSGNESQEATVLISIKKQKPDITYSDMAGGRRNTPPSCSPSRGCASAGRSAGSISLTPTARCRAMNFSPCARA